MAAKPMAALSALLLLLVLQLLAPSHGGITSSYVRRLEASEDMPLDGPAFRPPPGRNAPEQVHITQGDRDGRAVIVSWVTPSEPGSGLVLYGTEEGKLAFKARARVTSYKFCNYTSGYIHHANINNLQYDTKYYYEVGIGESSRQFYFTTPPKPGPDIPYTFGIIGDLGQTYDSYQTLEHYHSNPKGQAVLFVGDLSYADHYPLHDNRRWDSWGRFVEKSTAYQPWIWTAGNHEIDFLPQSGETIPFKPFTHRYKTPYTASNSTSPLWYSIKRGPSHVIVLSSYSAYGKYTPQYIWLQNELQNVDRSVTPWLIVLLHSPWYSSYSHHYMEGESMRVVFESWFVQNKVDLVFAGHVHAYERSRRISNIAYNITNMECGPVHDKSAPVYITIGDGGNVEGLVSDMTEPQPNYSTYREASFGHATLEIKNRTHAYYSWHRNQDGNRVVGDSAWFHNRYWRPDE